MAIKTLVSTLAADADDAHGNVFANQNIHSITPSIGTIFASKTRLVFLFPTPPPKGVKILSAVITLVSGTTDSSTMTSEFSRLLYDEDPDLAVTRVNQSARWHTGDGVAPLGAPWFQGWTKDANGDFGLHVRDAGGGSTIDQTGIAATAIVWALKNSNDPFPNSKQRLAQQFVVPAGADRMLGADSIVLRMNRAAGSSGIVYTVEIWTNDTNDEFYGQPGKKIATSDTVAWTNIPTPLVGDRNFSFSGAEAIGLQAGATYFCALVSDRAGAAEYANWAQLRTSFKATGGARMYGQGRGFDPQMYPGQYDFASGKLDTVTTAVAWNPMPSFTIGVAYSTPDITTLVQAALDDPLYPRDDSGEIGIAWVPTATRTRTLSGVEHATQAPAFLTITYDHTVSIGARTEITSAVNGRTAVESAMSARTAVVSAVSARTGVSSNE